MAPLEMFPEDFETVGDWTRTDVLLFSTDNCYKAICGYTIETELTTGGCFVVMVQLTFCFRRWHWRLASDGLPTRGLSCFIDFTEGLPNVEAIMDGFVMMFPANIRGMRIVYELLKWWSLPRSIGKWALLASGGHITQTRFRSLIGKCILAIGNQ